MASREEDEEQVVYNTDPAVVKQCVGDVKDVADQCQATLTEVATSVLPFYRNQVMCEAILRNLDNLMETIGIIRVLSDVVESLLVELKESLQLCLNFLREYSESAGAVIQDINADEEEEITNKLAFMNKLLHLNQHSLNIRLLLECAEHARVINEERAKAKEAEEKRRPSSADGFKPKLNQQAALAQPHRVQHAYGPLSPPSNFNPAIRAKEYDEVQKKIAGFAPGQPIIIYITGEAGVGKTSYALYIAQKLHSFLDFHGFFACEPHTPSSMLDPALCSIFDRQRETLKERAKQKKEGGKDSSKDKDKDRTASVNEDGVRVKPPAVDAETIMRAFLAPQQTVGLSPSDIQRAFRMLTWGRRGVLLIDNATSAKQVAALLPNRGVCCVIVTSRRTFPSLLAPVDKVNKIHQHLTPLSEEMCSRMLPDVPKKEAKPFYELSGGNFAVFSILKQQLTVGSYANKPGTLLKALTTSPTKDESKFLSHPSNGYDKLPVPNRNLQHVLYYLYCEMSKDARLAFTLLHVFAGDFDLSAVAKITKLESNAVTKAIAELLEMGIVSDYDLSPFSKRRALKRADDGKTEPLTPDSRFWASDMVKEFSLLAYNNKRDNPPSYKNLALRFIKFYAAVVQSIDDDLQSPSASRNLEGYRKYDQDAHNIRTALYLCILADAATLPSGATPSSSPAKKDKKEAPKDESEETTISMDTSSAYLLRPRLLYEMRFSPAFRAEVYGAYMRRVKLTPEEKARTLLALGDAHTATAHYEKAIPEYKQAQTVAEELKDTTVVATALVGLAKVSEQLNEHQIAIDYCRRCKKVLEQTDDRRALGKLLHFIAALFKATGAYQNVLELALKAKEVSSDCGDKETVAKSLMLLGEVYMCIKEWDKACDYMRDAGHEAQQIGDLRILAASLRGLDKCNEALGRFYKAHCYRERLGQLMSQSDLPLF